jgi:hypothetical protein
MVQGIREKERGKTSANGGRQTEIGTGKRGRGEGSEDITRLERSVVFPRD